MKQTPPGKRAASEIGPSHQIRIWIDNYDDIFSDFDPRDYSERNISDDFLREVKKVAGESEDPVKTLRLLIDSQLRDKTNEAVIVNQLHHHFAGNYRRYLQKRKSYRLRSIIYLLSGLVMILGASYFSYLKTNHPVMHIPLVILEPAGWFLTWTAFENMVRSGKQSMPDLVFYAKLGKSKIVFGNI